MSVALAVDGITKMFGPVMDGIDKLSTSAEERGALRLQFYQVQAAMVGSTLDYESKIVQAQASIVLAEAQGKSWLQRNWRPMLMCNFGFIIAWNFILAPLLSTTKWLTDLPLLEMPEKGWYLLIVGVGGYVGGRSAEKIAETLTKGKLDFSKGSGKHS